MGLLTAQKDAVCQSIRLLKLSATCGGNIVAQILERCQSIRLLKLSATLNVIKVELLKDVSVNQVVEA